MEVDMVPNAGKSIDLPIDLPEPETQPMDVDMVSNAGKSNEAIQRNGQTSGAVTSSDAGENGDEHDGENGDDVAMQIEHVAKSAPANRLPVRYLDGKRVSEYEWIRSENIKANEKLLKTLELTNVGKQIFGKQDRKKGKENKDNGNEPSTKRKKIPLANAGTRVLRSMETAIPNMCVYFVVYRCFIAHSSTVLQRRQLSRKRPR